MRTITETLRDRLLAEAEEADLQGLNKVASHLTDKIEAVAVRKSDASYTYADSEFTKDVESALWDAALRVADFHNANLDARDVQNIIERTASELIAEIRVKIGAEHGVGAFEPNVPGEARQTVLLDVVEGDE